MSRRDSHEVAEIKRPPTRARDGGQKKEDVADGYSPESSDSSEERFLSRRGSSPASPQSGRRTRLGRGRNEAPVEDRPRRGLRPISTRDSMTPLSPSPLSSSDPPCLPDVFEGRGDSSPVLRQGGRTLLRDARSVCSEAGPESADRSRERSSRSRAGSRRAERSSRSRVRSRRGARSSLSRDGPRRVDRDSSSRGRSRRGPRSSPPRGRSRRPRDLRDLSRRSELSSLRGSESRDRSEPARPLEVRADAARAWTSPAPEAAGSLRLGRRPRRGRRRRSDPPSDPSRSLAAGLSLRRPPRERPDEGRGRSRSPLLEDPPRGRLSPERRSPERDRPPLRRAVPRLAPARSGGRRSSLSVSGLCSTTRDSVRRSTPRRTSPRTNAQATPAAPAEKKRQAPARMRKPP